MTTPHPPKKSSTDYQQLTQIRSSIFRPPPALFPTPLSLTKIATASASTTFRQTPFGHSLRVHMERTIFSHAPRFCLSKLAVKPTATGAVAGDKQNRSARDPPTNENSRPSSTQHPVSRNQHRASAIHQCMNPPIHQSVSRLSSVVLLTKEDQPSPRYQPSTPQPSTSLRYRSQKMVQVMVRVAPHKTPVFIGLVHWYGCTPRYAPSRPQPAWD